MTEKSKAFVKGGCGCLLVFFGLGVLALLVGGRVRTGLGGLVILFVLGGLGGLFFLAIRRPAPQQAPPPGPRPWTCLACATDNDPDVKVCRNCREPY